MNKTLLLSLAAFFIIGPAVMLLTLLFVNWGWVSPATWTPNERLLFLWCDTFFVPLVLLLRNIWR